MAVKLEKNNDKHEIYVSESTHLSSILVIVGRKGRDQQECRQTQIDWIDLNYVRTYTHARTEK